MIVALANHIDARHRGNSRHSNGHHKAAMAFATPLWKADEVSLRWRSLAERRRSYFVELYNSGRWKQYYTEDAFLAQMREVVRSAEQWDKLVGMNAARANAPGARRPSAKS
jgi:hypothetical protein